MLNLHLLNSGTKDVPITVSSVSQPFTFCIHSYLECYSLTSHHSCLGCDFYCILIQLQVFLDNTNCSGPSLSTGSTSEDLISCGLNINFLKIHYPAVALFALPLLILHKFRQLVEIYANCLKPTRAA